MYTNHLRACLVSLMLFGVLLVNVNCQQSAAPVAEAIAPTALWNALFTDTPPIIIDYRAKDAYARQHLPFSTNDCGCPVKTRAATPIVLINDTESAERDTWTRYAAGTQQVLVLSGGLAQWPYGLDINADQLQRWLTAGRPLLLVDVRDADAWALGHIAGTQNIPLATVAGASLPKDQDIVFICQSGMRSTLARDALAKAGYTRIYNLTGGMNAWTGAQVQAFTAR